MWNKLMLKLYLCWYMPRTRIKVETLSSGIVLYYPQCIYNFDDWHTIPNEYYRRSTDYFLELEEAKAWIDKFLESRKDSLIKDFNTPKVRYIKYP
jgi:hypothetical protein